MNDYLNESWRTALEINGLDDFDSLWQREMAWFEEPNRRRGGWSGVSRCEVRMPDGGRRALFVKRQENHGTFSLKHPFRGVPTFEREFKHLMNYRAKGIPTLEPVYYAARQSRGCQRAILITEELTGFASLEDHVNRWLKDGAPPRSKRRQILKSVADLLQLIHDNHIQHSCFLTKHVFIRLCDDGSVEARVIDLEKSRWRPFKTLCAMRDLHSLNRFSSCWGVIDRLWFFKTYLGASRLTRYAKWLWRNVASRSMRKNRIGAAQSAFTEKR